MNETVVVASTGSALVRDTEITYVVTGIVGPPGPGGAIVDSADINLDNLTDGATLVYNASTSKFDTTTTLDRQIINGGFF